MNKNQKNSKASKNSPNQKADYNRKHATVNSEDKSIWVNLSESIGVGVFGILASICFSTDHRIFGIWFSFASLACLLALVSTKLSKKLNPSRVWVICGLCLVLFLIGFAAWSYQLSRPEPKTRLIFGVTKSSNPSAILYLTNEWFFAGSNFTNDVIKDPNILRYLVVPVKTDQTNVELNFMTFNDSPVDAEGVTIDVHIPETLKCEFRGNWRPLFPKEKGDVGMGWCSSEILLAYRGRQLPPISFIPSSVPESEIAGFTVWNLNGPTNQFTRTIVTLIGRAKKTEQSGIVFWLTFIPVTNDADLFIAHGNPFFTAEF